MPPPVVVGTRDKAIQRLYDFVMDFPKISEIELSYSTDREDAEALAGRIKAEFPDVSLYLTKDWPCAGHACWPWSYGGGGQRSVNHEQLRIDK